MDDKRIFTKILGLNPPWFIKDIIVDEDDDRIDIYLGHEKGIRVRCPECECFYGVYDHAPERVYRHLDTCHMQTFIHVRLPRVNCPKHGVKQIVSEFGENGSEMTFAFEKRVIRVAHECNVVAASARRQSAGAAQARWLNAGLVWSRRAARGARATRPPRGPTPRRASASPTRLEEQLDSPRISQGRR